MVNSESTPTHNPVTHDPIPQARLTNDPVINRLVREANNNMVLEVAQRIAASEAYGEILPTKAPGNIRIIDVRLSYLVRPRVVDGRLCSVVVRVVYGARHENDRLRREFLYYKDVPEAMATHPNLKVWPFPYADERRTPRMEMRVEMQQERGSAA
jgi:hypothetical protein